MRPHRHRRLSVCPTARLARAPYRWHPLGLPNTSGSNGISRLEGRRPSRLPSLIGRPTLRHLPRSSTLEGAGCELRHRSLSDPPMSQMGQQHASGLVRRTSALPIAPERRTPALHGGFVPRAEVGGSIRLPDRHGARPYHRDAGADQVYCHNGPQLGCWRWDAPEK